MVLPHVGVGLAVDQVVELQVAFLEQVGDVLAVEIAQVQDADFALEACHVVDDFLGLGFAESEVVVVQVELLDHFHEGLDGKGVVLRGYGEFLLLVHGVAVAFEDCFVVVVQLACLRHELFAFGGERDAAAGAVENYDADFLFEVADGGGERRLRNEQVLGGLVERAHLGDADGVTELLKCHGCGPSFF